MTYIRTFWMLCFICLISIPISAQMKISNSVFANAAVQTGDSVKSMRGTFGQAFNGSPGDSSIVMGGGFWYQISEILLTGLDDTFIIPEDFELRQNYPNPFNPSTTIVFALPKAVKVQLRIYDVLGRMVATLVNEQMQAGQYEIKFEARGLPTGLYFYRIQADKFVETRKMLLVK